MLIMVKAIKNELKVLSNKAANVLVDKANVQKGDRVFIFMPRTPELYFAFLGILKNWCYRWSII